MVKKINKDKKKLSKKKKKRDQLRLLILSINLKTTNKIQTEQMEARRMDNLSKELVDSYFKASRKSFLDMGYCAYIILFRVLQRMIFILAILFIVITYKQLPKK